MDIIRVKKNIRPNPARPEQRKPLQITPRLVKPEPEEKKSRNIWIIVSLFTILALILIMGKLFIFNSISSNQELFPEMDPLAKKIGDKLSGSNSTNSQASSAIPKANTPVKAPEPTPAPEAQPETQNPEEAETEETATEELTASPSQSDKFISKSPVKVSEITKISKFRSCAKEAYGETSFQDQEEPKSSLKHYFNLKDSGTSISAPFDGEIIRKNSNSLVIETRTFNGWIMDISGINPENTLAEGSQIKSGDKIGKSLDDSLEIAMMGFSKSQKGVLYEDYSKKNLDPFFSHLNDSVGTEFSDKGATVALMAVSKTDRDSKKCDFKSANDEDWITLK